MVRIKKLYLFILKSYLPLFAMTFLICSFVLLMQFLWKYIDDLVGKGLEVSVLAELFVYAFLSMVPLALPLAILLASLMVFGSLGERLELTAIKSAGVSLLKIMSPLVIFVASISIFAFFFQNNILPKTQVKMWTLLYSMRHKSPELDIPEGAFYNQITGFNMFVESKNRETGMLYDVMIYDVSKGYGSANIIVADSGKLTMMEDKQHLMFKLYQGEAFEDLKDGSVQKGENMMYRRESFDTKDVLITFDASFNRIGDEAMGGHYMGKDLKELSHTIDSVTVRVDSISGGYGEILRKQPLFGLPYNNYIVRNGKRVELPRNEFTLTNPLNVDSLIKGETVQFERSFVSGALSRAKRQKQDLEYKSYSIKNDKSTIRNHKIEMQKKFTLSFACLIFFFIGAPLGAIIRKGGLAVPIVVSVLMFIIYYIIDNSGYKLAQNGTWAVWRGVWLSSYVLFPLGVFLTLRAAKDSAVFNADVYRNFFTKLLGVHEMRNVLFKEIIIDDVDCKVALEKLSDLDIDAENFLTKYKTRQSYMKYWLNGYDRADINKLYDKIEDTVEYLSNSDNRIIVNKLMDFPILRKLLLYHPTSYRWVAWTLIVIFPIGGLGYLIGTRQQSKLKLEIKTVSKVSNELINMLKIE
ncbi:MAG: LptF/LptG family permease [Bacteroidales bacterium]